MGQVLLRGATVALVADVMVTPLVLYSRLADENSCKPTRCMSFCRSKSRKGAFCRLLLQVDDDVVYFSRFESRGRRVLETRL